MGILSEIEVKARHEIEIEEYTKKVQMEGRVLGDIARNHVIPTAVKYQNTLIENVRGLKEVFGDDYDKLAKEQKDLIMAISKHISEINSNVTSMINERKKANKLIDAHKKAHAYCDKVRPYFEKIRYHCDKLELMVDDEQWPLVTFGMMILPGNLYARLSVSKRIYTQK